MMRAHKHHSCRLPGCVSRQKSMGVTSLCTRATAIVIFLRVSPAASIGDSAANPYLSIPTELHVAVASLPVLHVAIVQGPALVLSPSITRSNAPTGPQLT